MQSPDRDMERERIYRALIALVAERGYNLTTVEMIVERAGVSQVEFDRRFSDLHDCFDQLWEAMSREFIAGLSACFEADEPWRDCFRASAYYMLRYFLQETARTVFFMLGTLGAGELAVARRDRMIATGVDLIDLVRDELQFPDSVSRATAEAVTGTIYQALVRVVSQGDPKALPPLVPQLVYIGVLPYFGPEAAQEELQRGPADLARYERGEL
jgi:AcrR family transcriptional regulator